MKLVFVSDDISILDKEICTKYWDIDDKLEFIHTVANLCQEYNTNNFQLSKILDKSCRFLSDEIKCPDCCSPYVFKNRTDFKRSVKSMNKNIICSDCVHKQKLEEQKRKYQIENQRYAYLQYRADIFRNQKYSYSNLNELDKIYLLTLIRLCMNEDFSYLNSITSMIGQKLTPSLDFDIDLLIYLYDKNLIQIHSDSPRNSIIWKDNEIDNFSFYTRQVAWILSKFENISTPHLIDLLENDVCKLNDNKDYHKNLYDVYQKLALQECLSYLSIKVDEYQLSFSPGDKTKHVITKTLKYFSVSQIYYFIDKACRDAVANYAKGIYSKKHASNTLVGSIERLSERAILENWEVKSWNRIKGLPQSYLSIIMFDFMLGKKDGGFYYSLDDLLEILKLKNAGI